MGGRGVSEGEAAAQQAARIQARVQSANQGGSSAATGEAFIARLPFGYRSMYSMSVHHALHH